MQAPYRSWWEVETLHENPLIALGNREPMFSVGEDGLARLELEPTTRAGNAILSPALRRAPERGDPRVARAGGARLDPGRHRRGHASPTTRSATTWRPPAPPACEEGYEDDGRVAFFAKGAIKGEFLLTAAYDSARDSEEAKERLLGVVEPDRYYTLYGDVTEQRFEAARTSKLYLKIERRQFVALFGDFDTGLTVTELTRYSRSLTGLQGGLRRRARPVYGLRRRDRQGS